MIGYLTVEQLRNMLAEYPDHAPIAVVIEDEISEYVAGSMTLGWAADGVLELRVS